MPRAGDAFLVGALPRTNDPLARIGSTFVTPVFDVEAFIESWSTFVDTYLIPIILDLTGLDLASLQTFVEQLEGAFAGILAGGWSAIVALLNPLLGIEENPNLLANGAFQDAVSVIGGGDWVWDDADGRTDDGCVKTTLTGTAVALRSNLIAVTEGQNLNLSVWTKWAGVTATGEAIKLDIVTYLGGDEVSIDTIDSISDPATNQTAWLELSDIWAAPSGVDSVRLRLAVENTSTGTVKFDDGVVRKTTLLQQQANDSTDNLQETWDRFVNSLSGIVGQGRTIDNLDDAIRGSVEAQIANTALLAQLSAANGTGIPDSDAFERTGAL